MPVRVVYARPRTFIAIAIGIVAFFLLPGSLRLVTRLSDRLGYFRRALSGARLHHDVALRRRAYPPQRGAAGRRPLPDPAGDRARRASPASPRSCSSSAPRNAAARADARDGDDRAVMGGGAHRLRAALRARLLPRQQAGRPAVSQRRRSMTTPTTGTSSISRS